MLSHPCLVSEAKRPLPKIPFGWNQRNLEHMYPKKMKGLERESGDDHGL